jgi:DNA-binding response OmpR family regulator
MQMHILTIVDPGIDGLLAAVLHGEGMSVTACSTGDAGLMRLIESTYNLVILDYRVHGSTPIDLLRRIRAATMAPIVVLADSISEEDMVLGLDAGADGFITRPFSSRVLAARVRALLRFANAARESASCIRFGEYTLDIEASLLKWRGRRVALSGREFEVLAFLATHPDMPMSPEMIHTEVLKSPRCDISAVSVYVQRLRRKIERDPSSPEFIKTVHGSGYKFIMDPVS